MAVELWSPASTLRGPGFKSRSKRPAILIQFLAVVLSLSRLILRYCVMIGAFCTLSDALFTAHPAIRWCTIGNTDSADNATVVSPYPRYYIRKSMCTCMCIYLRMCIYICIGGTLLVAQWLRHCAANRKVAGSLPNVSLDFSLT
jgi:hypothetical protein